MKRLAIYLRLSLEDEGNKQESNSIGNQRKLIQEYIHHDSELRSYEVAEFSDDGYSGTNMTRPGMQKMLKEVKDNNIQCIIVKDESQKRWSEAERYFGERNSNTVTIRYIMPIIMLIIFLHSTGILNCL